MARVGEHADEPGEDGQVGAVTGWPGFTGPSEVDE